MAGSSKLLCWKFGTSPAHRQLIWGKWDSRAESQGCCQRRESGKIMTAIQRDYSNIPKMIKKVESSKYTMLEAYKDITKADFKSDSAGIMPYLKNESKKCWCEGHCGKCAQGHQPKFVWTAAKLSTNISSSRAVLQYAKENFSQGQKFLAPEHRKIRHLALQQTKLVDYWIFSNKITTKPLKLFFPQRRRSLFWYFFHMLGHQVPFLGFLLKEHCAWMG